LIYHAIGVFHIFHIVWHEFCSDLCGFAMKVKDKKREEIGSMKQEQGFSLIELLIVVAIIAIIAAIAVPSMLTSRMAANEAGAIQGCRTIGSAEVAYAAVNNQQYAPIATLTDATAGGFLDSRFGGSFNGYGYAAAAVAGAPAAATAALPAGFAFVGTPTTAGSTGRYTYGIAADQVVRYLAAVGGAPNAKCGTNDCSAGDPIGTQSAGGGS
jgi:type IV pilus assembly protein PilA